MPTPVHDLGRMPASQGSQDMSMHTLTDNRCTWQCSKGLCLVNPASPTHTPHSTSASRRRWVEQDQRVPPHSISPKHTTCFCPAQVNASQHFNTASPACNAPRERTSGVPIIFAFCPSAALRDQWLHSYTYFA